MVAKENCTVSLQMQLGEKKKTWEGSGLLDFHEIFNVWFDIWVSDFLWSVIYELLRWISESH